MPNDNQELNRLAKKINELARAKGLVGNAGATAQLSSKPAGAATRVQAPPASNRMNQMAEAFWRRRGADVGAGG